MKTIPFWKMSGSGNDFVVVDNRRGLLRGGYGRWAKILCHRRFGVGADGLLLLEHPSDVRRAMSKIGPRTSDLGRPSFRMVYYNADGSRAEMCGNGARCMAFFARAHKVVGSSFRFVTDAYLVGASVQGAVVQVTLADAKDYRPLVKAKVESKAYKPAFLNTGVPHAVVFVPRVDQVDVVGVGRALRYHPVFGPKGTNVDFVQKIGPRKLRIRTYERGVEGETLACGTGVTAAAIAAARRGVVKQAPVQCVVAGGDTLTVMFDPSYRNVSLKGPVRVTFKGEFNV